MTPKQVKDIFNNLPSKRRKVLEGFLAGHSREKIMIDAGVPSDAALTGHLKELYRNFRINTGWNDADDRRSGTRKLPLLISLFAKCMPELLSEHIPEVLENVEQEGASPKLSQESAEVADIKENSSQASPSIEISSIREWRLKSINQLWSKDIGECISGIRKLERIAKDYPIEHWAIMEELAEFIRIRTRRKEGDEERAPKISEDIQAALTVIGGRDSKKDPPKQRLDLRNIDIRGAKLTGANLQRINFNGANLKKVIFNEANLQRAQLIRANLQEAQLIRANLQGTFLNRTELQGAILQKAKLQRAFLKGANLQGAFLSGADFSGASIESYQIESADGDSTTRLPKHLNLPTHWMQAAWDKGSVLQWLRIKKRSSLT